MRALDRDEELRVDERLDLLAKRLLSDALEQGAAVGPERDRVRRAERGALGEEGSDEVRRELRLGRPASSPVRSAKTPVFGRGFWRLGLACHARCTGRLPRGLATAWTAKGPTLYEARMLPHARIALFATGFLSACGGSATTTTTTPESLADERATVAASPEAGSTPAESPARGPGQCQISRIPAGGAGTLTRIAIGADGRWLERRTMEVPGGGALQLGYQWAGDVVSTTLGMDGGPPRTGTMTLRRGAREWIVEERWPDVPLVTWTWSLDAGGHATRWWR